MNGFGRTYQQARLEDNFSAGDSDPGWDDELASFYARLVMDYERGELGEGEDPEEEVVAFSCGERPGQFIEVEALEAR